MRRNPGDWLRDQLLDRALEAFVLGVLGVAWLCGGAVALWLTLGLRSEPALAIGSVLVPSAGVLGYAAYRAKRGWRLQDMKKGADAEKRVGQAIEYALTPPSCAVAHGVKDFAKVGDIDHLVATPHRLWVIETKHRRVPRSKFREVLRRIAVNVEGIREWAPAGTQVTGCLVLANEDKPPKHTYKHGRETIRAFASPESLMRELRAEAHEDRDGPDIVRKVWELGAMQRAGDQDGFSG